MSAFIDDAQAALDEIEADPSLLTERGQGDPFGDVQDQARELGLRDCASD